ncbi:MAG: hypothetical protein AABX38_00175 [Candidatus Micrarchaeota archaeon]
MNMNKSIILGILLVSLLFFGCINDRVEKVYEYSKGTYEYVRDEVNEKRYMNITSDENSSTILINAIKGDGISTGKGTFLFPLKKYGINLEGAGIYSKEFIRLTNQQIQFIEPFDGGGYPREEIYLTPIISDNGDQKKVSLFNAVYIYTNSQDWCIQDSETIYLLGQRYNLSELQNNSAFLGDDKWKVTKEYPKIYNEKYVCVNRIIISMNGYFDDIKEGDQISLFGNNNIIVVEFKDLETGPKLKIIATKPKQEVIKQGFIYDQNYSNSTQINQTWQTNASNTTFEELVKISSLKQRIYLNQNLSVGNKTYEFCGYSVTTEPNLRTQVALCENSNKAKGVYLPIKLNTTVNNQTVYVENLYTIDITKNQTKNDSYIEVVIFNK